MTTTSTWAEVHKDFYVNDQTGKTWHVTYIGKAKVILVDKAGTQKMIDRPANDRPVDIAYIPPIHHATQLLQRTLGATIVEEIAHT
jgi:hypothetical protein